ncbi:hypothetical protein MBLNU459_g8022t1 [Dothideomycetes sp. NU459]
MKSTVSALLAVALSFQAVAAHVIGRGAASASISASSSSASPVKNAGKRGLAYNAVNLTRPFSLSGQNSQVSWAYNWNYQEWDMNDFNTALDYVPMLWNNDPNVAKVWPTTAQQAIDLGSTALLSFNEPDWCGSGSSCMTVNASVAAYKASMQPFAGKALLGAPAVTNVGGANYGLGWLEQFLGNCTSCQIDFIPIHWYSNKWAGFNYFKQQVEAARAIAGGRPIWVTEFGLDSSDGTYSDADLQAFLKQAMAWMDTQSDVHRYAYFMDTPGMLITQDGSAMSDVGILYNNYTNITTTSSSSLTVSSTKLPALTRSSSSVASSVSFIAKASSVVASNLSSATASPILSASFTVKSASSSLTSASLSPIIVSSSVPSTARLFSSTYSSFPVNFPSLSTHSTYTSVTSASRPVVSIPVVSAPVLSIIKSSFSASISIVSVPTVSTLYHCQVAFCFDSISRKVGVIVYCINKISVDPVCGTGLFATEFIVVEIKLLGHGSKALLIEFRLPGWKTFTILSAYYADVNVTAQARSQLLAPGGSELTINTAALPALLNAGVDPWPGTVATLSVLYAHQGVRRVFVAAANTGSYAITGAGDSAYPNSAVVAGASIASQPAGGPVHVVALVWGEQQVRNATVFATVYGAASAGRSLQLNNGLFGVDGFPGHAKVGIVWYRRNGVLGALVARGGNWVKF